MDEELQLDPTWSNRRRNRAVAFCYLFQWEMNRPEDLGRDLEGCLERMGGSPDDFPYAVELVDGVVERLDSLDEKIAELVQNWEFSRIAKTDLALLRLAVFELLHRPDVPPVVAIDEAIELAKTFSTDKSRKFLNGILDKLRLELDRPAREALSE